MESKSLQLMRTTALVQHYCCSRYVRSPLHNEPRHVTSTRPAVLLHFMVHSFFEYVNTCLQKTAIHILLLSACGHRFYLQVSNGDKYVHCGDFRGCKSMQQCPHLQRFIACKGLFLDTTYCHPKHVFPAQSVAVEEVGRLCEQYAQDEPKR